MPSAHVHIKRRYEQGGAWYNSPVHDRFLNGKIMNHSGKVIKPKPIEFLTKEDMEI
jgi:hypothetical protein